MKKFISFAFLALSVSLLTSTASAEEWTLESSKLKAKGGAHVEVSELPKLKIQATLNDTQLVLNLSDGKKKFGAPIIKIKSGENVFTRPRLKLSVPIEEMKKVKSGKPLLVLSFSLKDKPFEINLVQSGSDLPDVVITSK